MFCVANIELNMGRIVSAPFDENTYIAHLTGRSDSIVFDPGFDPDAIFEYLDELLADAGGEIVCTHGHSDHIAGNAALKKRWPDCPLIIGEGDAPKLTDPNLNLSAPFGVSLIRLRTADRTLREGDTLASAGMTFDVLEAPGHSIGHIVLVCRQTEPWYVFGGDVLFAGSIGRTDFPGRQL